MKTFNHDKLIRLRRYFHSYPELSRQEKNACKFILKYIQDHTINTKILYSGKYGLIFQNQKFKDYINIGLRSEVDALPLQDTKEVKYKSKNDGITMRVDMTRIWLYYNIMPSKIKITFGAKICGL